MKQMSTSQQEFRSGRDQPQNTNGHPPVKRKLLGRMSSRVSVHTGRSSILDCTQLDDREDKDEIVLENSGI